MRRCGCSPRVELGEDARVELDVVADEGHEVIHGETALLHDEPDDGDWIGPT